MPQGTIVPMRAVEEVAAAAGAGADLAHGWTLHAVEPVDAGQAERVLREPAAAVPATIAARLGALRIFAVPYLACREPAEFVSRDPPSGESHSSLWIQGAGGFDVFIAFLEADAHDTGFELLAAVGQLLVPRLGDDEFASYAHLLERELRDGVAGEIDEEALAAKQDAQADYVNVSLAATLAEYMHALWHDVDLREGPEHLPAEFLRRRFALLAELFPPNPGYRLFRQP